MLKLEIRDPNGRSESRTLVMEDSGTFTFGRASANDFRVCSERVAKKHAEIRYEGGRAWLRDLRSTNGSLVNGQPLVDGGVREIFNGDRIQMDFVEILVSEAEPSS